MADQKSYHLKGHLLAACNCDWGCPCNFEAPSTQGFCEGTYVWRVESGHYHGTTLDGTTFAMFGSYPGLVHEGNATTLVLVDDRVPADRRAAVESMIQSIPPFSIFLALTTNMLGIRYAPFDLHLDGIRSHLTVPQVMELQLAPMQNPVTGEDELATLNKPTGFTSKVQELCSAERYRFTAGEISVDYQGTYGEFSPFEYSPG